MNMLIWRLWTRKGADPVVVETTWSVADLARAHSLLDLDDAMNDDAAAESSRRGR
jgi:hypothetical protein